MNIEVSISIDGQPIKPSDELQGLLENLVGSYIKQKFLMSPRAVKAIKNPNRVKRATRPHLTAEEDLAIIARGRELIQYTIGKAAKIISKEINRSGIAVYHRLHEAEKRGEIKFTPYLPGGNQWGKK